MMSVEEMKKEKMEALTFVQIMHQCHNQMSLKMGMKKHGDRAMKGMTKELRQTHMRDSFIPRHEKSLTREDWKKACEAVNPMKEKLTGEMKGRTCADGRRQ